MRKMAAQLLVINEIIDEEDPYEAQFMLPSLGEDAPNYVTLTDANY